MPIYYPDILQQHTAPRTLSYSAKDVMLYALSIGMGADPLDERELAFVFEEGLKVVPTAPTILATEPGRYWAGEAPPIVVPKGLRESSFNYNLALHGEQKIEIHKTLPVAATFHIEERTQSAFDKGKDKGAVIIQETTWNDASGERAVTLTRTVFARGDGGFGGPAAGAPAAHPMPARKPDLS
ncbi:MAG: 3-alpha,7-alpha,12-alpha-trihydroxy-5-beta-cholest-24-enoyl-CoA hydratase, partial [Hyphomonadaceae bacterium]